jgi:cyanobactin maturation PatA/PatG family protease
VHPILGDVLTQCDQQGVLVVAAAGNDGCDCLHLPAAHRSILAVGAADANGKPLRSSNWGTQYSNHGLLAIGEGVQGADPSGEIVEYSGTSSATAVVSGIAALLMCLQLEKGAVPSGPKIRQVLLESADRCDSQLQSECFRYLSGALNIERATSLIFAGELQMGHKQSASEFQVVGSGMTASGQSIPTDAGNSQAKLSANAEASGQSTAPSREADLIANRITPSACGCSSAVQPVPQLVFALGQLGFSFASEARVDSFRQHMYDSEHNPNPNPYDAHQLLAYLKNNPWDSSSIIWTLNFELTPVYAIAVDGSVANYVSAKLQEFLADQVAGKVERVSIPGFIYGRVRMVTGEELPVVHPEVRGMFSWNTSGLVSAVVGDSPPNNASREVKQEFHTKREGIKKFLDRVYYELRNLGQTSSDRAINYSATNAFEIERVYESAAKEQMELESISADPSPYGRMGSDCWDVKLTFFFPQRPMQTVKRAYRFTVDVSDIVPVTVGPMREWSIPAFGGY